MSPGFIHDQLSGAKIRLEFGKNLLIKTESFEPLGTLDSLDEDLLRVAASIYAADLGVKRQEREQHLRSIEVTIPVVNGHAFARVKTMLEQALTTLSCDNWTINFTAVNGRPASGRSWPAKKTRTLLFSGGLDSFVGAYHLLKTDPNLVLVSHVTHNRPVTLSQLTLAGLVGKGKAPTHIQVSVGCRTSAALPFPSDQKREETQRARSLLFTSLAAVAARLQGSRRIVVMAENGQFAIHLPLTEARIASFSTHTAHPRFLQQMQELLRILFTCPDLEVENPFVYLTKGEVVALLPKGLRHEIKHSVSCWRAARIPTGFTHCGECVPCLSRRIAVEGQGVKIAEYDRDLLKENVGGLPATDRGKRNLSDLCQFVLHFAGPHQLKHEDELRAAFPELQDSALDAKKTIEMYRRFAKEALKIFGGYPSVAVLLK
jgi:7-cyano-7-deazaguanine synthase in queuosine biosynthesis